MKILNLKLFQAVGLLECLFGFAAKFADDGRVGKYSEAVLADDMGWERKPAELVAGLKEAGYLEGNGANLRIHDWWDHCPEYVKKRHKRKAAASGGQWPPVEANGRPPNQTNQTKPDQNDLSDESIEEVFQVLRNLKGFVSPNRVATRRAWIVELLEVHGFDKLRQALRCFPLQYDFPNRDFLPHLQWLAEGGRVDDLIEGRYGPAQLSPEDKKRKRIISQGKIKLNQTTDPVERAAIETKLALLN